MNKYFSSALGPALGISVALNLCLAAVLINQHSQIEGAVMEEAVKDAGLESLSYFLLNSGMKKEALLDISLKQPFPPTVSVAPPEVGEARFYRFPVEVLFSKDKQISEVNVGGRNYLKF